MKALALFITLISAKIVLVLGQPLPRSGWSLIALIWQDALLALIFEGFDRLVRRPAITWTVYACLVFYIALNVPIARLLSTPLTWTMLRATRTTLSDSIAHHLTPANLGWLAFVLGTGTAAPLLLARFKVKSSRALTAAACALVVFGPWATSHVELGGLERNSVIALVESARPKIASVPQVRDWRVSPAKSGGYIKPGVRALNSDLKGFTAAARGRNVVLILLESTAAQYLGLYGASEDPMPHLTELGRDAVVVENAYAVYPESIKGLFSILCSMYPAFDTSPESYEFVRSPSVAQVLADDGYKTALFHSGRFMYLGMESIVRRRGFQVLEDAGDIGGNHNSSFGVDEPATIERILAWVDSLAQSEQFFLTYLPIAGHHPYDTPEPGPFVPVDELNRYRNALHYSDTALQKLLEGLRRRDRYQNTVFVVMGDHGEGFGQHPGNFGHTLFLYEENLRVPFVIAAPGLFGRQIRLSENASLIDAVPTLLELLGIELPPQLQGRSLSEPTESMALFFTDYAEGLLGLRDGQWKFIYNLRSGRSKLFDLAMDSSERNNLAEEFSERSRAYRRHLLEWSAAQKANILFRQNFADDQPARQLSRR